jgi:adenylylsulfate kinase
MSGLVVWITGRPSAGKTTFGQAALDALRARGVECCMLDGDAVRDCLVPRLGYTPEARAAFYQTLANLAALLARQNLVVLVPATAQRRTFREVARSMAPAYLEVWIDTPLDECVRRDSKGLYAAARNGTLRGVPGSDEIYEEPRNPDVIARGGKDEATIADLTARVLSVQREGAGRLGPPG